MSRNQIALRKRWWLLPIAVLLAVGGSYVATSNTTPTYQATCGLFLSIAGDTTPAESNQAGQLAQERVIAYRSLIKGERVAAGALTQTGVQMSTSDLVGRIETKAELSSVVIYVSVSDAQPKRSAVLANAVCDQFQQVAADIEAPNQQIKVKVVERADTPEQPIAPKLSQNLVYGALVGLFAGAALVLLLERIWPSSQPGSNFGSPVDCDPRAEHSKYESEARQPYPLQNPD